MGQVVSLLNYAERKLNSMFPGFFGSPKHDHYHDFGFPADVTLLDLYKIYLAWAAEAQIKFTLSINTFKQRMQANGYEQAKTEKANVWKGIGQCGWIAQAQTPSGGNQWMGRQRN